MFSPFTQKPRAFFDNIRNWEQLAVPPYRKAEVSPYTRTRILLMNAVETEAVIFGHQLTRTTPDGNLRRALAMIRRVEQQQQKSINWLIPADETLAETAIGYELLEVTLAACLALREADGYLRELLDFTLIEDLDHLYRYANLLALDQGSPTGSLVGGLVEILPGRPSLAQHRHPNDSLTAARDFHSLDIRSRLAVLTMTVVEQQAMFFGMETGRLYPDGEGRNLFREIAMIEEDHATLFGSLLDPGLSPLENLLLREYLECYLYYSCFSDEEDPVFKGLWELFLRYETAHLQLAASLLEKHGGVDRQALVPDEFPEPLHFEPAKEYVRNVLARQVNLTKDGEARKPVGSLPRDHEFFAYQKAVNAPPESEPGHRVVTALQTRQGKDYREEEGEHPVLGLQDRTRDSLGVGLGG